MAEKKKLGDFLKEAGLIDDFQLQTALSHQRNWGGKLGSILVELEFVREEELARVIAENMRIPYVNLFEPELPAASIALMKADVAKKYGVMPVRKEGNSIVIAMSDPLDIEIIDDLRFSTGFVVKPALALESEIKDAIRKYYDGEELVRKPKAVVPFGKTGNKTGKMEIIFGSDLMSNSNEAQVATTAQGEASRQELQDDRLRLDALITLLIEKNIINREDLVKMVYQKKIGL
jgi:type IV pilus assembly protein PilB